MNGQNELFGSWQKPTEAHLIQNGERVRGPHRGRMLYGVWEANIYYKSGLRITESDHWTVEIGTYAPIPLEQIEVFRGGV